jgi:hypothetical protein
MIDGVLSQGTRITVTTPSGVEGMIDPLRALVNIGDLKKWS